MADNRTILVHLATLKLRLRSRQHLVSVDEQANRDVVSQPSVVVYLSVGVGSLHMRYKLWKYSIAVAEASIVILVASSDTVEYSES